MAYSRGNGTVQVELARLQTWAEGADADLVELQGTIREYREERAARLATEEFVRKKSRLSTYYLLIPICMKLIEDWPKIAHFFAHLLGN